MTTNEIIAAWRQRLAEFLPHRARRSCGSVERFAALVAKHGSARLARRQHQQAAQGMRWMREGMRHSANGSRPVRVLWRKPQTLTNTEIGAWIQYAQQLLTTAAQAAPTQTAPAPAAQLPADGAMRTPEAPQPAVQQGTRGGGHGIAKTRGGTLRSGPMNGQATLTFWEPLYTYPAAPVAHGDALDAARYRWLRGEQQRIASVIDKEYSPGILGVSQWRRARFRHRRSPQARSKP